MIFDKVSSFGSYVFTYIRSAGAILTLLSISVGVTMGGITTASAADNHIDNSNDTDPSNTHVENRTGNIVTDATERVLQSLLPQSIFEGYWAATKLVNDMAVVLKYDVDGSVTLHEYNCNRPYLRDVSVKSDYDVRMRLIPTDDDDILNVYSYDQQQISSQLQNIRITGNMLEVEQVFVHRRPKEIVPFTYKHTETLTPICNHDKREKP